MNKKVIVKEISRTEKEIELEYPIYLYFQGDLLEEEYVMDDGEHQLKVVWDFYSISIQKTQSEKYEEDFLRRHLTKKQHFMDFYEEALKKKIKETVK